MDWYFWTTACVSGVSVAGMVVLACICALLRMERNEEMAWRANAQERANCFEQRLRVIREAFNGAHDDKKEDEQ
jgi:hypothetical protein